MTGDPMINIGCAAYISKTPTLYVTNENVSGAKPLHTVLSQNKALQYVYIYDAVEYAKSNLSMCHDIPQKKE
jgi:hypothetical protein